MKISRSTGTPSLLRADLLRGVAGRAGPGRVGPVCRRLAFSLAVGLATAWALAQQALLIKPMAEAGGQPGSEAFYVLAGEQTIRSAHGVMRVRPGQTEAGHGAQQAMQVSSSGSTDLLALKMFVVTAGKLFSAPATLPSQRSATKAVRMSDEPCAAPPKRCILKP